MAEGKKSFVLYVDQEALFEHLPDEQAGKLIKHIFRYCNDRNPETEDILIKVAFEPIKQQLRRDLRKWENDKKKRSEAGKTGMAKRWKSNQSITPLSSVIEPITKITDNVNVNVNVNDNVNVSDIQQPIEKCLEIALKDSRWVKANKTTIDELKTFNELLEKTGVYDKNPLDYKRHFANLKTKKPELFKNGITNFAKAVQALKQAG